MIALDRFLFFLINGTLHTPALDAVMVFITRMPPLVFAVLLLFYVPKERSRLILPMVLGLIAVGLSDSGGNALKHLIGRERPFVALSGVHQLVKAHGYSFPSLHASNAFAFALGVSYFIRRASLPMFTAAFLVGLSRVYVGVHYPSDVLAGMVWGTASFFIVLASYGWIRKVYDADRYEAFFYPALAVLVILRLYYIGYGPLDLIGDEAHYWEWSRRLALSYYSKGPLIAYLIALTTKLGGNNAFSVRLLAPLLLCFSSLALFRLTKDMSRSSAAGVSAGLLLQMTPLFAVFGVIMTIDAPFVFFWCLCLWLLWRAVSTEEAHYWYLAAAAAGFGFLAKYIMLFIYPCAVLFLLLSKEDRRLLKTVHPYLAFLVGLIVSSPVAIWNASHGWVTILHTAGHAHLSAGLRFSPVSLAEFAGSQIGVLTPLLAVLLVWAIVRSRRHGEVDARARTYLLCFSVPVFLFFLLKSIQGKVEANWAMVSYPSLFVLLSIVVAAGWKDLAKAMKAFIAVSVLITIAVTAAAHFAAFLPLPSGMDPLRRLEGWKELGHAADGIHAEMAEKGPLFILSDSYQVSSELAFYMKDNPVTYCINLGRRMNEYDLWPGFDRLIGWNALYVTKGDQTPPAALAAAFERCEREPLSLSTRQGKIMQFTAVKCYDFKGIETGPAESY